MSLHATTSPSAIAIIPARGGSKRLPRKNILPVCGLPMLAYPVKAALTSGIFQNVVVTTEDPEIAGIAQRSGAEVASRPLALADDVASVDQVCIHLLHEYKKQGIVFDFLCCIYSTALFITPEDIRSSYSLLNNKPHPDFVMGVSELDPHPYWALWEQDGFLKFRWPEYSQIKSQQFPDFVCSNGTLYWARINAFLEERTFHGKRLVGYKIPHDQAVDIDTREDYERACRLAKNVFSNTLI